VGKSVHIRADDHKVRIIHDGVEVAAHPRCWERRRHVQDPAHAEELLARRKAARPQSRRETLAAVCPESRIYFQEIARRRIRLDSEMSRIFRLVDMYGQSEVAGAIAKAVGQRTFGAKYVRALCDQARFARGLGEPPEPVVTGNREADTRSRTKLSDSFWFSADSWAMSASSRNLSRSKVSTRSAVTTSFFCNDSACRASVSLALLALITAGLSLTISLFNTRN